MKEVDLGEVERGVRGEIQVSVLFTQLFIEVWCSLTREFAVKNNNITPLILLIPGRGRTIEWLSGQETGQKLFILSMLPVLCSIDVSAIILELVTNIDNSKGNLGIKH